jgi:hypothetical protein
MKGAVYGLVIYEVVVVEDEGEVSRDGSDLVQQLRQCRPAWRLGRAEQ